MHGGKRNGGEFGRRPRRRADDNLNPGGAIRHDLDGLRRQGAGSLRGRTRTGNLYCAGKPSPDPTITKYSADEPALNVTELGETEGTKSGGPARQRKRLFARPAIIVERETSISWSVRRWRERHLNRTTVLYVELTMVRSSSSSASSRVRSRSMSLGWLRTILGIAPKCQLRRKPGELLLFNRTTFA
jgi:hypothetical protein